jgi:hypothetical protein
LHQYIDHSIELPQELPPSRGYGIELILGTHQWARLLIAILLKKLYVQLKSQLEELTSKKLIGPSKSPLYALIKNKYPLLPIDDILDKIHDAQIFNKIDLQLDYHQTQMKFVKPLAILDMDLVNFWLCIFAQLMRMLPL